jgi:hypothetical protein
MTSPAGSGVPGAAPMTWPAFLRDGDGAIVLEEVDEDARTATYRVYGRRSVTVSEGGPYGALPQVLREALDPPRFVPASRWR